ncbi:hypothetical protein ATV_gp48 [Bicaudavirus pozzuoliense]|uniref:Structural protein ORF800 n=2 Tax=Acidianus two-tailed virus TaxID=315953 RepID=Y800_ATV|nr:hypothetical protein ATV_gp48 [Acidianus two-tailed virus]Q3V4R2.1 RecName: Full=Structural protein ORF800 [Acidianus two-tailed virus]AON96525.1 hypothetical protein [Acidianus two-tailed phage variant 1]CAI59902.1 hypothetical protein [Acidianus two-tailed virus]
MSSNYVPPDVSRSKAKEIALVNKAIQLANQGDYDEALNIIDQLPPSDNTRQVKAYILVKKYLDLLKDTNTPLKDRINYANQLVAISQRYPNVFSPQDAENIVEYLKEEEKVKELLNKLNDALSQADYNLALQYAKQLNDILNNTQTNNLVKALQIVASVPPPPTPEGTITSFLSQLVDYYKNASQAYSEASKYEPMFRPVADTLSTSAEMLEELLTNVNQILTTHSVSNAEDALKNIENIVNESKSLPIAPITEDILNIAEEMVKQIQIDNEANQYLHSSVKALDEGDYTKAYEDAEKATELLGPNAPQSVKNYTNALAILTKTEPLPSPPSQIKGMQDLLSYFSNVGNALSKNYELTSKASSIYPAFKPIAEAYALHLKDNNHLVDALSKINKKPPKNSDQFAFMSAVLKQISQETAPQNFVTQTYQQIGSQLSTATSESANQYSLLAEANNLIDQANAVITQVNNMMNNANNLSLGEVSQLYKNAADTLEKQALPPMQEAYKILQELAKQGAINQDSVNQVEENIQNIQNTITEFDMLSTAYEYLDQANAVITQVNNMMNNANNLSLGEVSQLYKNAADTLEKQALPPMQEAYKILQELAKQGAINQDSVNQVEENIQNIQNTITEFNLLAVAYGYMNEGYNQLQKLSNVSSPSQGVIIARSAKHYFEQASREFERANVNPNPAKPAIEQATDLILGFDELEKAQNTIAPERKHIAGARPPNPPTNAELAKYYEQLSNAYNTAAEYAYNAEKYFAEAESIAESESETTESENNETTESTANSEGEKQEGEHGARLIRV